MSKHLKRLVAPDSWHITKKTNKFVTKTAPGPHDGSAIPLAVWLRDQMGIARNMKEVREIINQRAVIVNGKACRKPHMGIGVFDILSIPKIGKHYRILMNKRGRLVAIEISEEAAQTRLCKIHNKTVIHGGRIQLNLLYGANVLTDEAAYRPRDSVVVTLGSPDTGSDRFTIVDHFPFEVGNVAMVIGGRHSGKVGKIVEINRTPGSVPNRVVLEADGGARFDTIDDYVFMVGREQSVVEKWGIEE